MSVAPSFQNLEKVGSPFIENGREYIYVICKNGNKRKVRWYDEGKEPKKKEVKTEENSEKSDFEDFRAHDAFGFGEENFITIYDASDEIIEKWREDIPAFSVLESAWFGFYSPSYFTGTPPEGVRAIRLDWKEIRRYDNNNCLAMKDGDWVQHYVNEKLYGHNVSEYQGQKDEWLVFSVTIMKNIDTETHYGETHIHIMKDSVGNEYVWTTASKNLEVGKSYLLKMKVKEHKEYKGVKQTVVYYCKVI